MGRHTKWRKIAKRERRRRIRTGKAIANEFACQNDIDYEEWLQKQVELEDQEMKIIEMQNEVENDKWVKAEEIALLQWKLLQERKKILFCRQIELETKIKFEWEQEKQRREEEARKLAAIQEENKKRQEKFINNLEQFLNGDSDTPPSELLTSHETKPNCELCPFFSKTGCCRFGDQCSRNHQYPGISKVLLAPNFYAHFGLDNASYNEYDTDVMLEYEDSDTYKEFKDFFYDILPEFEKFGKIIQLKVCNNYEKHLRGNTYVEYADLRSAVTAYRALHTRWYGGKQLSLEFCQISSWKNAICGLQSRNRCPKGRSCNFLHVFRNPNNLFNSRFINTDSISRTSRRSWRWSESPEPESSREERPKLGGRKHHTIRYARSKDRHTSGSRRRFRSKN